MMRLRRPTAITVSTSVVQKLLRELRTGCTFLGSTCFFMAPPRALRITALRLPLAHEPGQVSRLTTRPIDTAALLAAGAADGAVCLFLGVVRDHNAGRSVRFLEYEAYEEMAERLL